MIDAKFFLSLPHNFKNKCKVYPPLVKEVAECDEYYLYYKLLTFSQEEIEDEFISKVDDMSQIPTPLEFLLASSYNDKEVEEIAKKAFKFFIKQEVTFIYEKKAILIGKLEDVIVNIKNLDELVFIEENDFFDFQNLIRESVGADPIEPPVPDEDPRVKRIKAKARYRDKIKMKKGGGISLGNIFASICCMGIGITPLNIGEISYSAILDIFKTYQEKEKYELDMKCILAGGDSKKIKPKYWIRNL